MKDLVILKGKHTLKWQNKFVDAFEAIERALLQKQNLSWQQLRFDDNG